MGAARPPRIVLYSHDTLGFGHLRRNLLIAGALRESATRPEILMITGMREAGAFQMPEGVDCVSLPAYAKGSDGVYRPRDLGGDVNMLRDLRAQLIRAAVAAFAPDLMIVDNVPRGALFELDPVLEDIRAQGRTRLALGLRDVIDAPGAVRRQWFRQRNFEAIQDFYSDIWIYGDPTFYNLVEEYGLSSAVAAKASFTGYLDQRVRLASPAAGPARDALIGDDPRPYVLCMVGGGRDGAAVCETFARAPLPEGHRGILVTGLQMPPASKARILGAGGSDLKVVDFVKEPIALAAGAARVVAMGGYNTICEVLSLGRPSLVVPRVQPRAEQILRAERLAARGVLDFIHPRDLSPAALGEWMASPRPEETSRAPIDLDGLARVRELAEAVLAAPGAQSAPALRAAV